jgi:4'-phosphopantetheinyl transferase
MVAPPLPWPALDAPIARELPADELRLVWCPSHDDGDTPRRQRIDALQRRVLAPTLGLTTAQLRFAREAKGRPYLTHEGAPDFNLSDTRGGTLFALSRGARVGVDLELAARTPPAARLAARYFAPEEARALAAMDDAAAARAFILSWTAKEASCKATGTGIFGYLPRWAFAVAEAQPRLLALPEDAGDASRWSFLRVQPSTEHTAVIAMRDAAPGLRVTGYTLKD